MDAEMSVPVPDFRAGLYYTVSLCARFCEIQVASRSRSLRKDAGLGDLLFAEDITGSCKASEDHQTDRVAYLPEHLQFVVVGV